MGSTLLKSILHNVGVSAVSVAFALLGRGIDHLLHFAWGQHPAAYIVGGVAFLSGFLLRVWAAFHFYERQMRVIALSTQGHLVTTGPFQYSRNPLYLGGNVLMFMGASLLFGSPSGVVLTVLHLPLVNLMIRREERQLEQAFGDEWREYERRVRRWI
jgi:protein-S-isoprenylcysteine O-methyltransferase Ste14